MSVIGGFSITLLGRVTGNTEAERLLQDAGRGGEVARSPDFLQPLLSRVLRTSGRLPASSDADLQTVLAIAASILIVVGVAGWALFFKQKGPAVVQSAVLDLRNRSVPRGGEANPGEQPLELSREVKRLNVYLPLGSAEGPYELRIAPTGGSAVFATSGVASLKDGVTSIQADAIFRLCPLANTFSKSVGLIQSGVHIRSYCDDAFGTKSCPPIGRARRRDVLYR
jgi:hypothetical protein